MNLFEIIGNHSKERNGVLTLKILHGEWEKAVEYVKCRPPVLTHNGRLDWEIHSMLVTTNTQNEAYAAGLGGHPEMGQQALIGEAVLARLRAKLLIPKNHKKLMQAISNHGGAF